VQIGVVSSKPRTTGRRRNRANPQVADINYYWFLYHLLNELRCRLVTYADQFLAQLLIPINLNKLKREDELRIYNAYRADLQTLQELTLEVKRWRARWELYPTDQVKPSHLRETLELENKKSYPHLYCIWKIYLTMSPSTATVERSFRHIYARQCDRKALLHIHRDIQLPLDAVVDKFNNTRQRKLLLALIVCKHPLH